jgi:Domain of unknown function (DUF4340)
MNHVNQKTLMGLGLAAVLAIVAAFALTTGRKPDAGTAGTTEYAIPNLQDHLNDVKSVSLTGAENKTIASLQKGAQGWTLKEKDNYRADVGKLRELLLKLADASLLEPKTSNEQRYAELGVSDPGDKEAKGVLITLEGLGAPASLIVGNVNGRADGTFVRRTGEKQSWLAKGSLTIDKDAAAWLDKTLTDIPATRIKDVTIDRPDGKTLRTYKEQAGDANFRVADIPKGREPGSEYAVNALGSALAGLNLDDVHPEQQATPPAEDKLFKARFLTFEGLRLYIMAWKQADQQYVRLKADIEPVVADLHIKAEQAKSQPEAKPDASKPPAAALDPAKGRQQRLDTLGNEVAALNQRFSGWTFVLSAGTFSTLDKSIDDLLKPVEGKGVGNVPPKKKSTKG